MAKKLYYKIGEACKILEIQPYVLRYWETEFPFLSPNKSKSGQRVYSDREIDVIRRIKELLYEEGYTIAGAKKKLEGEMAESTRVAAPPAKKAGNEAAVSEPGSRAQSRTVATGEQPEGAQQKAEELRVGVEVALRQAREILEVLR